MWCVSSNCLLKFQNFLTYYFICQFFEEVIAHEDFILKFTTVLHIKIMENIRNFIMYSHAMFERTSMRRIHPQNMKIDYNYTLITWYHLNCAHYKFISLGVFHTHYAVKILCFFPFFWFNIFKAFLNQYVYIRRWHSKLKKYKRKINALIQEKLVFICWWHRHWVCVSKVL